MSSLEKVKHLQIPLQELSDATNGFSEQNLIGRGGFGNVYKGASVIHGLIAIKVLDPHLGQGRHEFMTEIVLLSVCNHENIVSLLGFCDEDGQKILVYEYESNSSLDKHLKSDLTWIQRLQICLDAARGLHYLHDGIGSHGRIIHRDIKSANILLDENWKAKITDFGLSKVGGAEFTFVISNACGTIGYIDPDYLETAILTKESDVYSFGVVMFEVLCGRPARPRESADEDQLLTSLIQRHWERKTLDEIIHPDLKKQINQASLLTFATIAYQCLMGRHERPTMEKVVEQLEKALDNQLATSGLWWNDDISGAAQDHQGQSGLFPASSSQSRPVSSSPSWKYDVFISFRGEDTRKTFVDHLFLTLEDRQIFTYKDDEQLPRGELIGPSLFEAIQESRIAIIVFSQNYASSSWCLDELAYIMKNRDERRQTVIPIFYGVEPSELRKQKTYYGEALARHELNNRNKVDLGEKHLRRQATFLDGTLGPWPMGMKQKPSEKFVKTLNKHCLN